MIGWRPLTVVFGALPATVLSFWAALGMAYGVATAFAGLFSADIQVFAFGVLMFSWGGLGLYGTLSLWAVGLGLTHNRWHRGLKGGTIAILPFVLGYALTGAFDLSALTVFPPFVVACVWLVELHGGSDPPGVEEDVETDLDELGSRGTSC